MNNRRHSHDLKPESAPIVAEPARFEPRPFSAQDHHAVLSVQPHAAPAGVGHDFGQVQSPATPLHIQAKLMVGAAGDQHEQAADHAASQLDAQTNQRHQTIQAKALTAGPDMAVQQGANQAGSRSGQALIDHASAHIVQRRSVEVVQRKANNTGMPDNLKSGIENLSGISLEHVKVHYGSSKPAQLNALAYAQGSDIYVASGQEKHLPHEAWHVVQQAQGRVQPTMQMGDAGVAVNDDAGLEREADAMGVKALATAAPVAGAPEQKPLLAGASAPVQLKKLATMGGTFDTGQYEAITGPIEVKGADHTQDVGGVIDMSFISNAGVDGSFGIVQTGKAIRNKQPDYNKDRTDLKERMQDASGADPGRFMDRSKFKENPIFGLQNQKGLLGGMEGGLGTDFTSNRDALATRGGRDTVIVKEADEENHDISDVGGKVGNRISPAIATPASMRDEPARTRHLLADHTTGDAIRMEFETAALVLDGTMEGTYLGSVQWGFEIGQADQHGKPLPFEIVSMGTPTPAFMESANAWNDQAIVNTGGSNTTPSLPLHTTNHAPDLELQKLMADQSADKEDKIQALQKRIALLTVAQSAMDPALMLKLQETVADATLKFNQAKVAIDLIKQQRKTLAETIDPLRADRQAAGKKKDAGQTTLDTATSDLDRIGNKTPFYKARKLKDAAALKLATDKMAELDLALVAARAAVTKAETDVTNLDKSAAGFNKSDAVMEHREARIQLQNEKADLGNISFELAHLLKALDTLQSA